MVPRSLWNQTTNTGSAKTLPVSADEGSALIQKQSQSINSGSQVVVATTGLTANNASNSVALANGQSLVWGDNGLGKVPSVSISGVSGVNFRFASVWKVQNTSGVGTVRVAWPAGLTNLTLVQGGDPTFATVGSSTLMTSNTTSLNGVAYNYADVTLANGQYFTFATQLNGPGGIALNLRVWLRSDAGFAPDEWADLSGNDNNYTQTNSSRQPFVAGKKYNFNPIIDFGTTGADARFMAVPAGKPYSSNGTSSSVFTVNLDRTLSGYGDILGFGATTTTANLTTANSPVLTRLGTNVINFPYSDSSPALPAVVANKLYLNDVSFTVGAAGIKYGQNGATGANTQTFAAGNSLHANGSILGSQPEVRNGLIGEVIAYEGTFTEAEKQK